MPQKKAKAMLQSKCKNKSHLLRQQHVAFVVFHNPYDARMDLEARYFHTQVIWSS